MHLGQMIFLLLLQPQLKKQFKKSLLPEDQQEATLKNDYEHVCMGMFYLNGVLVKQRYYYNKKKMPFVL